MQKTTHRLEAREAEWLAYFWMVSRRLPLIILAVALALAAAGGYIYVTPRLYQANSLVRLRKTMTVGISPFAPTPQQNETLDLQTATQLVTTYLTVQEALQLLQDEKPTVQVRPAIREYLKLLKPQEALQFVTATSIEPDLVRISVRHPLSEASAALANGMAEAFVRRLNQEARAEASNERQFIESQLKKIEGDLQRLDQTIAQVYRQLGAVDIGEETKALVESSRTYTAEMLTAEAELQSLRQASAQLQRRLAQENPLALMLMLHRW